MSVGLLVGNHRYEIGSASFLKAFFSTIVMRLEAGNWGSRYPTVMRRLYMGEVAGRELDDLRDELKDIRRRLKAFTPDNVVWDFESPEKQPPWGKKIHVDIKSLSDYFWTADGKELFEVLLRAIDEASSAEEMVRVG
jgi:2,3-bisphosphoglycerate-dependent phosphoglycerate mutase